MRYTLLGFFFCCLLGTNLYGTHASSHVSKIERLIQEVKRRKGDDRRKAMNELKTALRKLNATQRQEAMRRLRASLGADRRHSFVSHPDNMHVNGTAAQRRQQASSVPPSTVRTGSSSIPALPRQPIPSSVPAHTTPTTPSTVPKPTPVRRRGAP